MGAHSAEDSRILRLLRFVEELEREEGREAVGDLAAVVVHHLVTVAYVGPDVRLATEIGAVATDAIDALCYPTPEALARVAPMHLARLQLTERGDRPAVYILHDLLVDGLAIADAAIPESDDPTGAGYVLDAIRSRRPEVFAGVDDAAAERILVDVMDGVRAGTMQMSGAIARILIAHIPNPVPGTLQSKTKAASEAIRQRKLTRGLDG